MSTINLLVTCMIYSGITGGACASLIRTLVSSGKEFHVDQAVLFPCPAKAEIAAHPVNARNKGSFKVAMVGVKLFSLTPHSLPKKLGTDKTGKWNV